MKNENPSDPFKRAVASAMRALAGEPELEVTFSAEAPMLRGKKARLPLPARSLPADEVAAVRGAGDGYALRLAYHEDKHRSRHMSRLGGDASAIFEAAEQARVEAIGALAMPGVATEPLRDPRDALQGAWFGRREGADPGAADRRARPDGARAADGRAAARDRQTRGRSLARRLSRPRWASISTG